jgi:type I restriction enzyme M protein
MTTENKAHFLQACPHLLDDVRAIDEALGREPIPDWNAAWDRVLDVPHERRSKWTQTEQKLFRSIFGQRDPNAAPVALPFPSGRGPRGRVDGHPWLSANRE